MDNTRVEDKIDKVLEDISEVKITMARNTASLEVHIKRSDLLEEKLIPIEKHVNMVRGAMALVGFLATIAAMAQIFLKW